MDCVPSYLLIQKLIKMPVFQKVFLENHGVLILIDFYEKTCLILHGRQYDRSLQFLAVDNGTEGENWRFVFSFNVLE